MIMSSEEFIRPISTQPVKNNDQVNYFSLLIIVWFILIISAPDVLSQDAEKNNYARAREDMVKHQIEYRGIIDSSVLNAMRTRAGPLSTSTLILTRTACRAISPTAHRMVRCLSHRSSSSACNATPDTAHQAAVLPLRARGPTTQGVLTAIPLFTALTCHHQEGGPSCADERGDLAEGLLLHAGDPCHYPGGLCACPC